MQATFLRTVLAVAIAAALTGCDRDNGTGSVGQRLDSAIDRTQHKLAQAGEKAQQKLAEAGEKTEQALAQAGEKTQEKLAQAGDKIAQETGRAADNVREATVPTSSPPSASGAKSDAGRVMSDTAITASIKTDYLKDPDLSVLKIDVDTRGGVVTLNGLASDESARTRAERIASAIKGVKEVRNFLVVKRA